MTDHPHALPDRIAQLGRAFMGAKALLSAVELGVFTTLAERPLYLDALAERTGIDRRGARDFFDDLAFVQLASIKPSLHPSSYGCALMSPRPGLSVATRGHSAVDDDFRAGDEARLVGCQEQCRIGGVAPVAHEAERDAADPLSG
jgi:hypothetical protein